MLALDSQKTRRTKILIVISIIFSIALLSCIISVTGVANKTTYLSPELAELYKDVEFRQYNLRIERITRI